MLWGNLTPNEWLADGALTDAGKALIEQRFGGLETNPRASVPWEEAKLRLMAPLNLKKAVAATQRRKGAKAHHETHERHERAGNWQASSACPIGECRPGRK